MDLNLRKGTASVITSQMSPLPLIHTGVSLQLPRQPKTPIKGSGSIVAARVCFLRVISCPESSTGWCRVGTCHQVWRGTGRVLPWATACTGERRTACGSPTCQRKPARRTCGCDATPHPLHYAHSHAHSIQCLARGMCSASKLKATDHLSLVAFANYSFIMPIAV